MNIVADYVALDTKKPFRWFKIFFFFECVLPFSFVLFFFVVFVLFFIYLLLFVLVSLFSSKSRARWTLEHGAHRSIVRLTFKLLRRANNRIVDKERTKKKKRKEKKTDIEKSR